MLRDELGLRGRDPQRRSRDEGDRQRPTPVPDAAVQAIAAGCDGVLSAAASIEAQAAALEALVHAVEDGRIPLTRVEDALTRQRRAKERSSPRRGGPASRDGSTTLRHVVGLRRRIGAIADEMAPFRCDCDQAARPAARRPHRARRAGQPVRRATSSTRRRGAAALGFEPVFDDVRLRARGCSRRVGRRSRGGVHARLVAIPSIAALIAVRGGYGSVQLLPLLDAGEPQRRARSCSSATATTRRSCRG